MTIKDKLIADLVRAGRILSKVKEAKSKLSSIQTKEITDIVAKAKMALRREKFLNSRATKKNSDQRLAIKAGIKDSSISKESANENMKKSIQATAKLSKEAKKIEDALLSIANIEKDLKTYSAGEELEKLDKGYTSTPSIKEPEKPEAVGTDATGSKNKKEESLSDKPLKNKARPLQDGTGPHGRGMGPGKGKADGTGLKDKDKKESIKEAFKKKLHERIAKKKDAKKKEIESSKEVEKEAGKKSDEKVAATNKKAESISDKSVEEKGKPKQDGTGPHGRGAGPGKGKADGTGLKDKKSSDKKEVSASVKASKLYDRAVKLIKEAANEKDAKKKKAMEIRANVLERQADKIASTIEKKSGNKEIEKKAGVEKKAEVEKEADIAVFSAQDKVLLPDGTVGTVSSINGDKVMISVGGMEKEAIANTIKKITSYDKESACGDNKEKKEKKMSIKEKISEAISKIKGSKKTAQEGPEVAVEGEEIGVEIEKETETEAPKAESPEEETVSKSEVKNISFVEGEGYVVNKSETEVISFGEDKEAAENYVEAMKKEATALTKDTPTDSSTTKVPDGSEGISSKMKGLDQNSKDYGTTTKEEKVNPERAMVGKASKKSKATAQTKDSPVDGATTKVPDGSENIVSKIKGLTQKSKGYTNTTSEEKVNPQLGVYAKKNKVLAESNKKKEARLKELESTILVDRAVKVGAITEADRSEQQQVLAELYATNMAEFKAYARLIENLEKQNKTASVTDRTHKKIASAMNNRNPVIVDGSEGIKAKGSLDDGNFFEDEL